MKVKELIEALSLRDPNARVAVWLPGQRIDLAQVMNIDAGEILIEGNVREGVKPTMAEMRKQIASI